MDRYSIADIAKIAGVSKATVSRVINNKSEGVGLETKEKILDIIHQLNYRPNSLARSVAISRSKMIGLIIPDISNLFYPAIVRGVSDYIQQYDYSLLLYNSDSNAELERKQLLSMVDKRVDGVILCSGVSNEAFLKEYRRYGVPLVLIGRIFDSYLSDGSITGDNEKGLRMSTQYIIGHGNRKILYLEGNLATSGAMQRMAGYRRALEAAGIPYDEKLVYSGEFSIQYGYQAVQRAREAGVKFDAVVSGSDLIAIGAVKALREAGLRVWQDVEVIGFDNIELSKIFTPGLSTVSKPHYAMATEASRILLSCVEKEPVPLKHLIVETELVLRETTRPD